MRVEIACSLRARLRGLLGRKEYPDVLLLAPCNDVHTFGMRDNIDIAFVSADGVVLESYRCVGPRRRRRCRKAAITLERLSAKTQWFEQGDRVELKDMIQDAMMPSIGDRGISLGRESITGREFAESGGRDERRKR